MAIELHHREQGQGPALVILHGLYGSSSNWRGIARQLEDRYRVVLVDLRNHGRSPHAAGMRYPELAADALALLDRLDLERVHLLGHSMGGKAAMCLALGHGERLASLTVADIAPVRSASDHATVLAALRALDLDTLGDRAQADRALATRLPDPALRAFLLQNLASGKDGFTWRIGLDAIEAGMDDLLDFPAPAPGARFAGPALFVRGARSDYLLPEHWPGIERLFPGARLATVDDAGHWLHAEQPAAFLAVVGEFLRSIPT